MDAPQPLELELELLALELELELELDTCTADDAAASGFGFFDAAAPAVVSPASPTRRFMSGRVAGAPSED